MRMRYIVAALVVLLPAALAAQEDSVANINRIAAIVGTRPILASELEERVMALLLQEGNRNPDQATIQSRAPEMLNRLIDREILLQIAEDENITIDQDRLERAVEDFIRETRGRFPSETALSTALAADGFASISAWRSHLTDQIRREELPRQVLTELRRKGRITLPTVPDSLVSAYFEQQKQQLGRKPASISFHQLIVKTQPSERAKAAARARADSLLVRIRRGESFETLASTESMDTSTAKAGGELGWQRRGQLVPEFEREMLRLNPTEVSGVVETAYGYHIIRVDKVEPARVFARHILIQPAVDSADLAITIAVMDTIAQRLRAGASFDSLANKYMDQAASGQRFIVLQRENLPEEYAAALSGLKPGEVSRPFTTRDSRGPMPAVVVAVLDAVEEERDYTDEEIRRTLRTALQGRLAEANFLTKMRKQTYIKILL